MFRRQLLLIILLILSGCQQERHDWKPIVEETDFDYLNTNIERSLSLIDDAYSEAGQNRETGVQEKLHQAKSRLLEIKDYYIPLTTVRQKIYDSERYFKLDNIKRSEKLLKESQTIVSELDLTTKNSNFDKLISDLNSMVDAVISSFDKNSKTDTYNKIKTLGQHVNLMLSRGDLVLSGIEFEK